MTHANRAAKNAELQTSTAERKTIAEAPKTSITKPQTTTAKPEMLNGKPKTPPPLITPDILIQELAEKYPETIETLIVEYGFHCVGCFASQFETLEEGARVHGIVDADFEQLMETLERLVQGTASV